ncbi:hypothetical protein BN7_107 [Wickerhamomyces ciferrii]|uniref:Protein kinase domain-containing protein n=1 Tax=Wickerhamomyces ciferrii (strain ATCC 14091 / BCRC 22168 / CBS 111 / JCM 3599 / NBRC 0793 / NRRL Y-1031 F-60-10) TaxID=1206466 RepID=K0KGL7_WICCF|nr:uncharacterized protein BN7_107 [Wickerhamomyces ciferrii]CCH40574.1 hypothetical protein BN7_107 [Wickerhamomyces ciferrii]
MQLDMSSTNYDNFESIMNSIFPPSYIPFIPDDPSTGLQAEYQSIKERIILKPMSILDAQRYFDDHKEAILKNVDEELLTKTIRNTRFWKIFQVTRNPFHPIIINLSLIQVLASYLTSKERIREWILKTQFGNACLDQKLFAKIYKMLFVFPKSLCSTKVLHTEIDLTLENQNKLTDDHANTSNNYRPIPNNDERSFMLRNAAESLDPPDTYLSQKGLGMKRSISTGNTNDSINFQYDELPTEWIDGEVDKLEIKLDELLEPSTADGYGLEVMLEFYNNLLSDAFNGQHFADHTTDPEYKHSLSYYNDVVAPVLKLLNFATEKDTNKRALMINNSTNISVKQSIGQSHPAFEFTTPNNKRIDIVLLFNHISAAINSPVTSPIMLIESKKPRVFRESSSSQMKMDKFIKTSSKFKKISTQAFKYSISLKLRFGVITDNEYSFFYCIPKEKNDLKSILETKSVTLDCIISNDRFLKAPRNQGHQTLNQLNRVESTLLFAIFIARAALFGHEDDSTDDSFWQILRRNFVDEFSDNVSDSSHSSTSSHSESRDVPPSSNMSQAMSRQSGIHSAGTASRTDAPTSRDIFNSYFHEPVIGYNKVTKLNKLDHPSLSTLYLVNCKDFHDLIMNYIYEDDKDHLQQLITQKPDSKILIKVYIKDDMMEQLIDHEEDEFFSFKRAKKYTQKFLNHNVHDEVNVNKIVRYYNNEKLMNNKPDECLKVPLFITSGVIIDENKWSAPELGSFAAFEYLDNLVSLENEADVSGGLIPVVKKLHSLGISHGDIRLENVSKTKDTGEIILMDFNRSRILSDNADNIDWQRELKRHDFYVLRHLRYDLGLDQPEDENLSDYIN